jgi:hypothetical protein
MGCVADTNPSDTAWCVCLLEQLGFLISPQTGYFMRFLGQGNHFTNFEVKIPLYSFYCLLLKCDVRCAFCCFLLFVL